jgi:hypothetical protein
MTVIATRGFCVGLGELRGVYSGAVMICSGHAQDWVVCLTVTLPEGVFAAY